MKDIDEKLARAWSIENIYNHKEKAENITYIGSVIHGIRVYRVYEDSDNDSWYETCFLDPSTGEVITEKEKIFGQKRGMVTEQSASRHFI